MLVMRASFCIIVNKVTKAIIHHFLFAFVSGHTSVLILFNDFGSKHITDDTIDLIFDKIFIKR